VRCAGGARAPHGCPVANGRQERRRGCHRAAPPISRRVLSPPPPPLPHPSSTRRHPAAGAPSDPGQGGAPQPGRQREGPRRARDRGRGDRGGAARGAGRPHHRGHRGQYGHQPVAGGARGGLPLLHRHARRRGDREGADPAGARCGGRARGHGHRTGGGGARPPPPPRRPPPPAARGGCPRGHAARARKHSLPRLPWRPQPPPPPRAAGPAGTEVLRLRPVSIVHPDHPVNVARQRAAAEGPGSIFADQFENLANMRAHLQTGAWRSSGFCWGRRPAGLGGFRLGAQRFRPPGAPP
jgi:hypothetical protein